MQAQAAHRAEAAELPGLRARAASLAHQLVEAQEQHSAAHQAATAAGRQLQMQCEQLQNVREERQRLFRAAQSLVAASSLVVCTVLGCGSMYPASFSKQTAGICHSCTGMQLDGH